MSKRKKKRTGINRQLKIILASIALLSAAGCGRPARTVDRQIEYGIILQPKSLVSSSNKYDEVILKDQNGKRVSGLLEPGEYTLDVIADGSRIGTSNIVVRDTVAPYFSKESDHISLSKQASFIDPELLRQSFRASDLSGAILSIEDDAVQYGEPGEYEAVVTAEDDWGNKREKKIRVVIEENEEEMLQDSLQEEKAADPETVQESDSSSPAASAPANGIGTVVKGILIVNKKNPISPDYNPGNDPVAVEAVNRLIADMQSTGLDVSYETSGFRDYNYQASLYNAYAARDGAAAADTYSARPGYSEHQTGLTFDMKHADGSLITRTPEAEWLKNHCAEYGFIIRYPEGKEAITGYDHEPWHLRYVGTAEAKKIMAAGQTLEEYLNVEGGDYR